MICKFYSFIQRLYNELKIYQWNTIYHTDIDECKSKEPMCSHICQNFPGSYNCSCHHGYKLTDDGKCSINGMCPECQNLVIFHDWQ